MTGIEEFAEMLARNPSRMDYQRKYEEIVADDNKEKDRTTAEETFRRLIELVNGLDEEQRLATGRQWHLCSGSVMRWQCSTST